MSLHVQQFGNGPDLVLLHGWGMQSAIFQPLVAALQDKFRLTLIDLPGHGASGALPDCRLEQYVEQLTAVAPEQAVWVGWSLGGMLATAVAHACPERVKALVLLATSPRFVAAADWPHAMGEDVLAAFGASLQQDAAATIKRFLSLVAWGSANQEVLRLLRKQILADGLPAQQGLKCGMELLSGLDLRHEFQKLPVPLMAIMGERDMLVPVAVMDDMQTLNNNLVAHVVAQAGHAPFLSHTVQCVQLLEGFLQ